MACVISSHRRGSGAHTCCAPFTVFPTPTHQHPPHNTLALSSGPRCRRDGGLQTLRWEMRKWQPPCACTYTLLPAPACRTHDPTPNTKPPSSLKSQPVDGCCGGDSAQSFPDTHDTLVRSGWSSAARSISDHTSWPQHAGQPLPGDLASRGFIAAAPPNTARLPRSNSSKPEHPRDHHPWPRHPRAPPSLCPSFFHAGSTYGRAAPRTTAHLLSDVADDALPHH